jgi:SAM-dependent methyltransferase
MITELGARARAIFEVDETVVSALSDVEGGQGSAQERYRAWRRWMDRPVGDPGTAGARPSLPTEYLLPRIRRRIERTDPPFMARRPAGPGPSRDELAARVDELGPWHVPFLVDDGLETMDGEGLRQDVARARTRFRRELITGTVAELLGNELAATDVLDIGCNAGFFSLDLADRGARSVTGVDLRGANIAQAEFLRQRYGIDNAAFSVADAADLPEQTFDVVLNLGVLYHVTDPLPFVRQTYELAGRMAVLDTVCHREPYSGYVLLGDKDVEGVAEGRESYEVHPTYRGAIDTLRYAGFREILEVVGEADPGHALYDDGGRRCFLAFR